VTGFNSGAGFLFMTMSISTSTIEAEDETRCADFFSELHPDHALLLLESGISPEIAAARQYESVTTKARLKALGFSQTQQNLCPSGAPALLIPIHDMHGDIVNYEIRPAKPRLDEKGKPKKYERRPRSTSSLDIPNLEKIRISLRADGPPLFITEGAKKVDCGVSHGLLVIGVLGVTGWRGTQEVINGIKGLTALADWERIHLKGRFVYLAFDSDVRRNKNVRKALRRLKRFLASFGADVWVCWLPDAPDGSKQGLDDFLVAGHTTQELFDTAIEDIPPESDFEESNEITFNLTDTGNAQRLVHLFGEDLRNCTLWGRWLVWDGKRWRIDDTAAVWRLAKETVASIYGEAKRAGDEDRRMELAKWAMQSERLNRIDAMIKLASSDENIVITPDSLDSDHFLLNVNNGTVDLKTGVLREHCRDDLITKLAPVDYDASAKMERTFAWLREIMEDSKELIEFLKRMIGYSLTGDIREQILPICYGTGANGKSTLLGLIQDMLGDYATSTSTNTLMVKRGDTIPNDLAALNGARFVTAMEVEDGQRFSESLVKQLTGGDVISARFMRGEFFTFKPKFKIWMAVNHKPMIRGTDNGIWRRIRLVPFNVSIPEAEQDKTLSARLREELSGLLAWAVEGCLEWQREGLGVPDAVKDATSTYKNEMDIIGQFISECCFLDESASVRSSNLFEAWCGWAQKNGEHQRNNKWFSNVLAEKGYQKKSRSTGAWWEGIGLQTVGGDEEIS
jgi:putative DNA primase/helicase